MKLVKNVFIDVRDDQNLRQALARKIGANMLDKIIIKKKSLDARKKNHLKYNYTLLIDDKNLSIDHPDILDYEEPQPYLKESRQLTDKNPIIIGAGPAGLFAALALVEKGLKPLIFDRGEPIERRTRKVEQFWKTAKLDEESNVQFGEGGAGTFSDGKLTSRSSDYYSQKIFEYFIKFGADEAIIYEALPHLGTDQLRAIVIRIRKYLEDKGALFYWSHTLNDIQLEAGRIKAITINHERYEPEIVILAIGNGSRDSFLRLSRTVKMEVKPFSVGFRIEHKQDFLNKAFYGKGANIDLTGAASYRLTAKHKDRGIYSFCMCPGGYVIGASSEAGGIVTNGMSYHDRAHIYGNSAVVASVDSRDTGKTISSVIDFQRHIENKAFNSNMPYLAPIQRAIDFSNSRISKEIPSNSYEPGTYRKDLGTIFPNDITKALKTGLKQFDRRVKGFISEGVIIGPETRTSSPVRILRDRESFTSISANNLYPIGEGAGYAGGIISSAVDGYKVCQLFYL